MRYIDLNMVRAGVVNHPADWHWCGYQEIAGHRQRYRILDLDELLRLEGMNDLGDFAEWYCARLNEAIEAGRNKHREPHWTESIAVGSEAFVRRIAGLARNRKKLKIKEWADAAWYVRDPAACYGAATDGTGVWTARVRR